MQRQERLKLQISCDSLSALEGNTLGDPVCALYEFQENEQDWAEAGTTEVVQQSDAPTFKQQFTITYNFEKNQKLRFTMFDMKTTLAYVGIDHNYYDSENVIGFYECTTSCIVKSKNMLHEASLSLDHQLFRGNITIKATPDVTTTSFDTHTLEMEPLAQEIHRLEAELKPIPLTIPANVESVTLQCSAKNLDKKDLLGKSDPFFLIYKPSGTSNERTLVYKSETIMVTLNPVWKGNKFFLSNLCNFDKKAQLQVEVFDWDAVGTNDLIGKFSFTVKQLLDGTLSFAVIHPEKLKNKQDYVSSGTFIFAPVTIEPNEVTVSNPKHAEIQDLLDKAKESYKNSNEHIKLSHQDCYREITTPHLFASYLGGGLTLKVTMTIDYTSSNGPLSSQKSLHYVKGFEPTPYEKAITSFGSVMEKYIKDKQFTVVGYGGYEKNVSKQKDFYNIASPKEACSGIAGILTAYRASFDKYSLGKPAAKFAPLIKHIMNTAPHCTQDSQNYHILLLFTNGECTDLSDTLDALITASDYAMSVIIVGIGNGPFLKLETLDSAKSPLTNAHGNKWSSRHMVQYLPMSKQVAEQSLQHIPSQIVTYMTMNNVTPLVQ